MCLLFTPLSRLLFAVVYFLLPVIWTYFQMAMAYRSNGETGLGLSFLPIVLVVRTCEAP